MFDRQPEMLHTLQFTVKLEIFSWIRYISPSGSDGNSGTSTSDPFLTLNAALNAATADDKILSM